MKRMLVAATLALGFVAPAAFAEWDATTPNQYHPNPFAQKASEKKASENSFVRKFDLKEPSHESPTYID